MTVDEFKCNQTGIPHSGNESGKAKSGGSRFGIQVLEETKQKDTSDRRHLMGSSIRDAAAAHQASAASSFEEQQLETLGTHTSKRGFRFMEQ